LGEDVNEENFTPGLSSDISSSLNEMVTQKEQIIYSGFIAQDVEKTAKEIGYDFSGVDAPKNENDLYGLRYAEFVVPLVKAVQELDQENEELKAENAELKNDMADLKARLDKIEVSLEATSMFSFLPEKMNQSQDESNEMTPGSNKIFPIRPMKQRLFDLPFLPRQQKHIL
jgi:predicted RNase H-like nuclease (RuvC/YqgF family)